MATSRITTTGEVFPLGEQTNFQVEVFAKRQVATREEGHK